MKARLLSIVFGLWLLAGVQYFWIAPQLIQLPADYAEETLYEARARFRETPDGDWQEADLIARRVDRTLVASAEHSIIQGSLHWTTATGVVAFETTGIYGVDRRTRMNLPGYGDISRHGKFLFPPHTKRGTYRYWDPHFLGSREAVFEGSEQVGGLPVYVFRFAIQGLDESSGYSHLLDVPERYRAFTNGQGRLWIEPTSGVVVDYQEQGLSYFAEPATGKHVADLLAWNDRYTAQTRASKLRHAQAERWRIHGLELGLPLALLLAGAVCLLLALQRRTRGQPTRPAAALAQGGPR